MVQFRSLYINILQTFRLDKQESEAIMGVEPRPLTNTSMAVCFIIGANTLLTFFLRCYERLYTLAHLSSIWAYLCSVQNTDSTQKCLLGNAITANESLTQTYWDHSDKTLIVNVEQKVSNRINALSSKCFQQRFKSLLFFVTLMPFIASLVFHLTYCFGTLIWL